MSIGYGTPDFYSCLWRFHPSDQQRVHDAFWNVAFTRWHRPKAVPTLARELEQLARAVRWARIYENGKGYMAKANQNIEVDWLPLDVRSVEQKKAVKAYSEDEAKVFEAFFVLCATGCDVTFKRDEKDNKPLVYVFSPIDKKRKKRFGIRGQGGDHYMALSSALYKFEVLAGGKWEREGEDDAPADDALNDIG